MSTVNVLLGISRKLSGDTNADNKLPVKTTKKNNKKCLKTSKNGKND